MPPSPRPALALIRPRAGTSDALLAAVVIAVVALMVVPLPTFLLDLLLATNLAISVAVLLVSLYVSDALKIAAFPTLLLITTLVRLGLNVASTRLILLQADAGEVIRAFGGFVVRGNYVVGAVVFAILAIIQFVVIAKGSERVAEVGARFTLDAMPGKQLAIDAELRSGSIDAGEARARRRQLMRESQFYGAMDGAMKFVKGDVIASLLITGINLFGGLAIGVLQRDMTALAALRRYGLLTIGDGLVTQIPALLLATAAGVLVTRVASEEPETPLGEELFSQLFGAPRALSVSGVFVLGLAIVPGLPALPFLAIGALLLLGARWRRRALSERADHVRGLPRIRRHGEELGPEFLPVVVPWSVRVSADLQPLVGDHGGQPGIAAAMDGLRQRLFARLGAPLAPCRVEVDLDLPERHAVLSIHEIPAHVCRLPPEAPARDLPVLLADALLPVLEDRAADFLGLAETQDLLDRLEQVVPATVRQVVPKPVSLDVLTEVLRRLLEEGVSIRDLKSILEALANTARTEKDPLQLAEAVRCHLRRTLTHELTAGKGELPVVLLDPPIEETIRSAISRTESGSFLTLAPAAARDVVRAVARAIDPSPETTTPAGPVLLTHPDIRRFVRKLLETDLPHVRVISFAELLPEVVLKPAGKASLIGLESRA